MTESTPNNPRRRRPAVDPGEAYIAEFTRRITALLSRKGLSDDVDDMVGREVLAVWHDIDAKMAAFPDPGFLAHIRATADRALIGFLRTEKSQRGEGARGGRSVVSLNRRDADHTSFGIEVTAPMVYRPSREGIDQVNDFVERIDDIAMMQAALLALPQRQRTVLYMVDGQGYTVTEAAHTMGVTRETASRDRAAAYRTLDIEPPC